MKSSFLDFYKVVISKVSFNRQLVYKEAKKALRYLNKSEKRNFLNWFRKHYGMSSLKKSAHTQKKLASKG